jgi:hypothetical protein
VLGLAVALGVFSAQGQPATTGTGTAGGAALTITVPTAQTEAARHSIPISSIVENQLVGQAGERLGEIEKAVESRSASKRYLVVARGGFLGMFERHYLVPVDELAMKGGQVVAPELAKDEFESLPQMSGYSLDYRELGESDTLELPVRR